MPRKKKTEQKQEEVEGLVEPRRTKKSEQKKLIEMQMADGKIYNKRGVKSIDELLGISTSKYKTHDVNEYERFISNLNTSDLQTHATKVGVMPNHDRNILVKRLLKEFRVSSAGFLNKEEVKPIQKKIRQETLDILSQGR